MVQPLERCTDVVVDGPGGPLLGHTEQWYAGDQGAVGIVIDVAEDGPTVLAPVVAGTLPLVGINGFGMAVGAMSLSARDERIGIPRSLARCERRRGRDGTGDASRTRRRLHLSNGFPDGESRVAEVTFPAAPGSLGPLPARGVLVGTVEPTMAGVVAILSDHEAEPQGICVHPDPAEGDEGIDDPVRHGRRTRPALAHDHVRPRLHGRIRNVQPRGSPLIVRSKSM